MIARLSRYHGKSDHSQVKSIPISGILAIASLQELILPRQADITVFRLTLSSHFCSPK